MTTYKESGVDIETGDECSRIAYMAAIETFKNRENMIGASVELDGGFSGLLDMGSFYLVQNEDTVGSKADVAWAMKIFDTLGYDLAAMVVDDGVCLGAEMISMGNTIEIAHVDENVIRPLMKGLKAAAKESRIIVPGGEIAEMSSLVSNFLWGSTAIGVVSKDRVITGTEIQSGDAIIGLKSRGMRSNGLSLARHILKQTYGEHALDQEFQGKRWGEQLLTPSLIFAPAIMNVIGTFAQPKEHSIKGIAHVTGGGIANNLHRILKKNKQGAQLDTLFEPHPMMLELQKLGEVNDMEAYNTWNMGVGMLLVTDDPESVLKRIPETHEARQVGVVVDMTTSISLISRGARQHSTELTWDF